jgi:cysteine desulfuration protein SufE
MSEHEARLPARLRAIVDDFALAEGSEKLELLLEYAQQMPPLPPGVQRDGMEQIHECMTPVFVVADNNDGMRYYFDIPPESPTVRGFASLLSEGVRGESPEAVLRIPGDFYDEMGLPAVLSPRRLQGVHAILAHMKRLATRELGQQPSAASAQE